MPKSWPTRLGTVRYCVHVIVEQHRIIITEFNCTAKIQPSTCKQLPEEVSLFSVFPTLRPPKSMGHAMKNGPSGSYPRPKLWINLGATEITSKLFWAVNPGVKSYLSTTIMNKPCTCKLHIKPFVCHAVCCVTMKLVLKKKSRKHYRRRITSSFRQSCLENLMLLAGFPEHLPPANGLQLQASKAERTSGWWFKTLKENSIILDKQNGTFLRWPQRN